MNESFDDFEQQGEETVRLWVNTALPLEVDQVQLRRAKAWLQLKEAARATSASDRKETREVEALTIARQSLANSNRATFIAVLALILSASKILYDAFLK